MKKKGLFQLKVLLSLRRSFSVTQYDLQTVDWSQFKSWHLAAIFTVSNYQINQMCQHDKTKQHTVSM